MASNRDREKNMSPFGRVKVWRRHHREAITAWAILAPMILYFMVMTFVPLVFLIAYSFMSWNIINQPTWIGFDNLFKVFSNYHEFFYLKVIGRTVLYALAILALNIGGAFTIALLLNQNIRLKGFYRTMWYLPAVFSGAVVAWLLKIYLAASNQGVLNMVLFKFGMTTPINWIYDSFWMPVVGVLFVVWQGIGFTTIFFLAGMQGIDENLYDAAKIDGANTAKIIRYITIPQLIPVFLFISVTGLIGSMQMWEVPRIITMGGPDFLTYTLVFSIQTDAFGNLDFGMATAQSLVLFVILLGLIGWQLNNYRKQAF